MCIRDRCVGDDDIEEAPVISDIEDRNVLRHMFLADDRYFCSCQPLDQPEYELNDMKRAFVTKLRVLFSDEPFHHKDRNGEDEKGHHNDQDQKMCIRDRCGRAMPPYGRSCF